MEALQRGIIEMITAIDNEEMLKFLYILVEDTFIDFQALNEQAS